MPKQTHVFKSTPKELCKWDEPAALDFNGCYAHPIAPSSLLLLYGACSEHARAIQIKAECTCGNGLSGEGADKLEKLCSTGAADLFTSLLLDQETYGNAYLQLVRSNDKRLVELRRLPAITMARTPTGYQQRYYGENNKQRQVTFKREEIVHLRPACPAGGYYALPTWIAASGMLELVHAATKFNASYFANSAIPEYIITTTGTSRPPDAMIADLKDFFERNYQGPLNSHRVMHMHLQDPNSDIRFEKITDNKDGEFLKLLDAARERVVTAHGVPPRMLGIVSAGQLGGGGEVAQQLFVFEHLTLRPKRRRLLDQLRPLLQELGISELKFTPLDLTPPSVEANQISAWVQAGILSSSEARELLGYGTDNGEPTQKSAADGLAALLARL